MTLQIRSIRTGDLDDAGRAAVVALCIAAHGNPDFERLFTLLQPDHLHVMAFDGDALVGHAVIGTRWAQPEGHPQLRTAYIDAVSTSPEYQGTGVGSAVMREVARLADDKAYEIAGLETERQGFYARLGWEEWRGPLAGREPDGGLVPTPDQRGVMILRVARTPELELDSLLTIERQSERIW